MKLIKFLALVIVGLVITNVTLTNRSVDESILVADLSSEISELQNQNRILESQVAEAGSLDAVRQKLAEIGFVETPAIVSITVPGSVASR